MPGASQNRSMSASFDASQCSWMARRRSGSVMLRHFWLASRGSLSVAQDPCCSLGAWQSPLPVPQLLQTLTARPGFAVSSASGRYRRPPRCRWFPSETGPPPCSSRTAPPARAPGLRRYRRACGRGSVRRRRFANRPRAASANAIRRLRCSRTTLSRYPGRRRTRRPPGGNARSRLRFERRPGCA